MRVLLTGATGFLGHYVTQRLETMGIEWVGISRDGRAGLKGNLTSWDLGLDIPQLKKERFDAFLHMGAIYDLKASPRKLRATNISGTLNALITAHKLNIPHFINISSIAAVVNSSQSLVRESDTTYDKPYSDIYGETKAYGERLVKQWAPRFESCFNLRLGILVGDTQTGKFLRVDGPYFIPEAFRKLKTPIYYNPLPLPLPGKENLNIPILPVDSCALAIAQSLKQLKSFSGEKTLHIVPSQPVPIRTLYEDSLSFLGLGHKKIKLINNLPLDIETRATEFVVQLPKEELFYLSNMPEFDNILALNLLPEGWCTNYHDYKEAFWRGYENYIQNC